jgi:pSer/pThr/pTyr-binding forkhead associated (FHA) protein
MQVKLKVLQGSHEGKEIAVSSDQFLIGRSDSCQLRPKSESISRKHCILVIKDGKLLAQDLKSRNGTFVNEKRLPSDRARVLKSGDHLRLGKLSFEVVIEYGLSSGKRPEVADMGDAVARMVEAGAETRFEAVDVSSWLEEADQIDRVRKEADPETRQFRLDQGTPSPANESETSEKADDPSSTDLSVDDTNVDKKKRPEKKKPGKLPDNLRAAMSENSREAADNALKKFFTR